MSDWSGAVRVGEWRGFAQVRPPSFALRQALLLGVAGLALTAAAPQAVAVELTSSDGGTFIQNGMWTLVGGGSSPSAPTADDTVTIEGGQVWVDEGGVAHTLYFGDGWLSGGSDDTQLIVTDFIQTGGTLEGYVTADRYELQGGASLWGSKVTAGTYVQTGGELGGEVFVDTFEHLGGTITDDGSINAVTYKLRGADVALGGGGLIRASELFDIDTDSDITLAGGMQGEGKLVKSGTGVVLVLTEGGNGITGDIDVQGGTFGYREGWTARTGAVTIAEDAAFRSIGLVDTKVHGAITGKGRFEQTGGSVLGVGGTVDVGEVAVTDGTFRVGTKYMSSDYGPEEGQSTDAKVGKVTIGSEERQPEDEEPYTVEGHLAIERGSSLTADELTITAGTIEEASDGPGELAAASLKVGTLTQSGGRVSNSLTDLRVGTYDFSGGELAADVTFFDLFKLSGSGTVTVRLKGDGDAVIEQSGGTMNGVVEGVAVYNQSGGTMASALAGLTRYIQSGGTITGTVSTGTYELAGGTVSNLSKVTIGDTFLHTAGTLNTNLSVKTYEINGTSAVVSSGKTITASNGFKLGLDSGAATVDAKLSGTGKLTKSGNGVVVVSNAGNDFSGGVVIEAGTLNAIDDALPDNANVSIGADATLQMTIGSGVTTTLSGTITGADGKLVKDGLGTLALNGVTVVGEIGVEAGTLHVFDNALDGTDAIDVAEDATLQVTVGAGKTATYGGSMTGEHGALVKDGDGTLTLSGSVYLGVLAANAGRLNVGTGTSVNEVSFESAVIQAGATVYVAKDATLTIRIPNNIVNNGTLINDGTVNDDLDNNSTFANFGEYNAHVASNTSTIDNNSTGVWTGNVLTNGATINNNAGAEWVGSIKTNAGTITNKAGATWTGAVEGNTNKIQNEGTWAGDVKANGSSGYPATFMLINNAKDAVWTGDVIDSYASIRNVGGTWNGHVVNNHADIINDNLANEVGTGTWKGDVKGNNKTILNAGGGVWRGNITGNAGTIKNDRSTGYSFTDTNAVGQWFGDVIANTESINNRGYWTGDIKGNSRWLYNTGDWTGNVVANSATIFNAADNYNTVLSARVRAAFHGAVKGNAGSISNMGGDWTGDVEANTGYITNAAGTLNTAATGDSTWTGKVVTNAGTITNGAGGAWTGDVLANTGLIDTSSTWTGNFTNSAAGRVKASGQLVGSVTNAGTFTMTGALTGITTLTNSGTVDLRKSSGAGQVLTVGTLTMQTGSSLAISLDTDGNTDKLVAGTANLAGTVKVTLNPVTGNTDYSKTYTILDYTTRNGSFAGVTTDLAFLAPQLDYSQTGHVKLTLQQNQQDFNTVAKSPNQKATADAIQDLGSTNSVYAAIVPLTASGAQEAFEKLSGSSQGATQAANLQSAHLIGQVLTNQVERAFDAVGSGAGAASSYAAGSQLDGASPTSGFWGQFYGAVGIVDETGTVAAANSATGGFAAGIDGELGAWRLGVTVQAGMTGVEVPDLGAMTTSTDFGGGVYGGVELGDTRLSFGGNYTRHDIDSTRNVVFGGLDQTLTAAYAAGTAQAFAQLSHAFDFGSTSLTPFGAVEYVLNSTDGYSETGGTAALIRAGSLASATFATIGVNASHQIVVGDDMLMTLDGGLGWRRGYGDAASYDQSFTGGQRFTILGEPIAADMMVLSAGINLDINASTAVDLAYDAQFAPGSQTHGVKATWDSKF